MKTGVTDLDLPPAYRTQANLWKAKFFEMHEAVVQANKGIRRLRRKIDIIQSGNKITESESVACIISGKKSIIFNNRYVVMDWKIYNDLVAKKGEVE